ncbi:MAG: ABC transporter permease [Defluviitaleaceae bacterium]|nr:ABC transporter permease [Defluviitaleaceae bacterium]
MTAKAFLKTTQMIGKIYFREFSGPFFSVVFPVGMLLLFGGIYGNEYGAMDEMVPALAGMIIAVNGIMTLPLNLSEYMTNKVYKRFDATPVGKGNIILVQILVYLLSTFISTAIIIVAGRIIHDINITGAWYVIFPAILLSCAAVFAMGFFIAAVFKNGKLAQIISYIVYFIMIFLSGATVPLWLMPENIRTLANALPLTHIVILLQNTFSGQPVNEQFTAIFILLGIIIACGLIGAVSYRNRKWA